MIAWLKRFFEKRHDWDYINPFHRNCRRCARCEVLHEGEWEVFNDGNPASCNRLPAKRK